MAAPENNKVKAEHENKRDEAVKVKITHTENCLIIQSTKPASSFWETGWTKSIR